jgi:hypothetical protein
MNIRTVLIASILVLAGCGEGSGNSTEVPIQSIERRSISGVEPAQNVVIRDTAAWEALWTKHTSLFSPPLTTPTIDFNQKQVVAVFIGYRSNGCYSVEITRVFEVASITTVEYHEGVPEPSAICTANITNPVHLVSISSANTTIQFVKK